jgi:hypothetical protein
MVTSAAASASIRSGAIVVMTSSGLPGSPQTITLSPPR